jgi:hypothetical protein
MEKTLSKKIRTKKISESTSSKSLDDILSKKANFLNNLLSRADLSSLKNKQPFNTK